MGLGDGDSDLHRHDWQVNIIDGQTKLVRQDAILGGMSIGHFPAYCQTMCHFRRSEKWVVDMSITEAYIDFLERKKYQYWYAKKCWEVFSNYSTDKIIN